MDFKKFSEKETQFIENLNMKSFLKLLMLELLDS